MYAINFEYSLCDFGQADQQSDGAWTDSPGRGVCQGVMVLVCLSCFSEELLLMAPAWSALPYTGQPLKVTMLIVTFSSGAGTIVKLRKMRKDKIINVYNLLS